MRTLRFFVFFSPSAGAALVFLAAVVFAGALEAVVEAGALEAVAAVEAGLGAIDASVVLVLVRGGVRAK